jgi:hypothetical protein
VEKRIKDSLLLETIDSLMEEDVNTQKCERENIRFWNGIGKDIQE